MKVKLEKEDIKAFEEALGDEIHRDLYSCINEDFILNKIQDAFNKELAEEFGKTIAIQVKKYLLEHKKELIKKEVDKYILKFNK